MEETKTVRKERSEGEKEERRGMKKEGREVGREVGRDKVGRKTAHLDILFSSHMYKT